MSSDHCSSESADNLIQTYIDGKRPLNFSFELVSIGGDVRFYANLPTSKTKSAFEAAMYSQYPGVEVVEESVDYMGEIVTETLMEKHEFMSFHMNKKKPQEFPIKTYIDYGLDKLPKEEEKLDPLTPMLELISTIRPFERICVQYICTPFKTQSFSNGQLVLGESESWEKGVEEKINELMNRDPETKAAKETGTGEELARLTSGERSTIEAMERNAGKYAYDVGVRWLYISKKGEFNGNLIAPMIRTFSQFDIIGRNAIGVKWRTDLDYKDFIPGSYKKIDGLKVQELKEYKLRKYFNKGGGDKMAVWTTEELASVWHIPGQVAITPNLSRISSTRSEAPVNLPIGELPQ